MDKFARISAIDGYDRDFISSLNIIVIGAGAIGNEVVKNLTLFGVGNITLFDFDLIEIHNLTRSVFFREEDVGFYKSDIVAKRAMELSPDTIIRPINSDFWNSLSFEVIKSADVVICAVDNFEARIRLNNLCMLFKKLLINTGIDSRYASVEVFPFNNSKNCACYECAIPNSVYEKISERYSCGWIRKIHSEQKTIPTTTITSSTVSAFACSLMFEFINLDLQTNNYDYSMSRKVLCDTKTFHTSNVSIPVKKSCVASGHDIENILFTSSSRKIEDLSKELEIEDIKNIDIKIQFSEPVLLYTISQSGEKKIIFDKAENYDVSFLMDKNVRSLTPEIIEKIDFIDLLNEYKGYDIPSKYIILESDKFNKKILVEMKNE